MKRVRSSLVGLLALLVAAAAFWQVAPLPSQADAPCNSPITLTQPVESSVSTPRCYRFNVPINSKVLRIKLEAKNNGTYDLYYRTGTFNALANADRLNESAIAGKAMYAFMSPASGAHTIVVYPQKNGRFRLEATAVSSASTASNQATSSQAGDMTRGKMDVGAAGSGGLIELGSAFGDRVVFPLEIGQPGQIYARATWKGAASKLALIINGPDRPELANPVAYYARSDSGSPLEVRYNVTQADFQRGRKWRISLVNFSGGLASATVEFTFPAQPAQAMTPAGGDLPRQATIELNTDRPGQDYADTPLSNPDVEQCRRMCVDDLRCAAYTLSRNDSICHLKAGVPAPAYNGNCVSGAVVIRPLTMEQRTDRPGYGWDYDHRTVEANPESCRLRCIKDPRCGSYTYVHPGGNSTSAECYLKSVAAAPVANRSCCVSGVGFFRVATTEQQTDRPGQDYAHLPMPVRNPALCRLRCAGDSRCVAYTYTWDDGVCHLKSSIPQPVGKAGCESGVVLRRNLTSEANTDRPRQDYRSFELPDKGAVVWPELCRMACGQDLGCRAYAYKKPGYGSPNAICYLKSGVPKPEANDCCVTGLAAAP